MSTCPRCNVEVEPCAEAMEGVRRMYLGDFVSAPLFSDDALSKD